MHFREVPGVLLSLALAFGVLFLAGEGFLRLTAGSVIDYDVEMTRYANELKIDAADPRIGHLHRPGASARLMGVEVEINANGLRDRDYPIERVGGERIVFLGDSLTFGWGVEVEQRFESLLERSLNERGPTEILNFGAGNYNTEQEVALFLERGLGYSPDRVVLFYFINDAEPTPRRSAWSILGRSRMATFVWSRATAAASRLRPARSFRDYYAALYRDDPPGWRAARAALVRLRDECRARNIRLQLVVLPELHDLADYPFGAEHDLIRSFLAAADIEALDLLPYFRGETDPHSLWVALDDAHPNALAHARIAEYVLPFLAGSEDADAERP